MTMRDEFEAWWLKYRGYPDPYDGAAWIAWQAAYRAGAEAMRESAARETELAYSSSLDESKRLVLLAARIRALSVDAD